MALKSRGARRESGRRLRVVREATREGCPARSSLLDQTDSSPARHPTAHGSADGRVGNHGALEGEGLVRAVVEHGEHQEGWLVREHGMGYSGVEVHQATGQEVFGASVGGDC